MAVAGSTVLAVWLFLAGPAGEDAGWRFAWQGDARFSHRGFTDLANPYHAVDAWTEIRIAPAWTVAPYVGGLAVVSTAEAFWWQRSLSGFGGVEAYPLRDLGPTLGALRPFAKSARGRLVRPAGRADIPGWDVRAGVDFYRDALFGPRLFAWDGARWRMSTN